MMAKNPKWERKLYNGSYTKLTKAKYRRRKWFWRHPDKWTDYPVMDSDHWRYPPIRKVDSFARPEKLIMSKWTVAIIEGITVSIKFCYLYGSPRRHKLPRRFR